MFTHQILIASYATDFLWLRHCLRSLEKFSTGFLRPVVAVPSEDYAEADKLCKQASSRAIVKNWDGPGFGRAQDAMMSGDILCPEADYFWLLGSDCLATRPFSPAAYCNAAGLPLMLYNTWEHCARHAPETLFWRSGVEKALGGKSHGEYMRRLPLAYPGASLEPMRQHVSGLHGVRFTPYVYHAVNIEKNFSESNVMGEWAFRHHPGAYQWECLDGRSLQIPLNDLPLRQFWSHGGLDRPHDGGTITPREVILQTLGSL